MTASADTGENQIGNDHEATDHCYTEHTAEKGSFIQDACGICANCAAVCPQNRIREGTPFAIDRAHCLHCGICANAFPAGAVEKR